MRCDIISALVCGRPGKDIADYADAPEVITRFTGTWNGRPPGFAASSSRITSRRS